MERPTGVPRIVLALAAAAVSFAVLAAGLFYEAADVAKQGWRFGGPAALAGEMAALFGGALGATVVLIAVLRWGRRRQD